MPSAPIEQLPTLPESSSSAPHRSMDENRRFSDLRGVQWRIDLGIFPSSSSSSIDDLRRVTANARRRYAALRRRLLVDPPKDGSCSPDLVMDNPLSQNPDSMWGRFFKNAELERMVDQDLSRLYPEHGSYFQTSGCQSMLRRILLLWCLGHPEYGYRQGMHELLAPLLYVLHVDAEHLSEVRKLYEDHFTDKFDGFSFHENDLKYHFDFQKKSESMDEEIEHESQKVSNLRRLDPKIEAIVLLCDAYGAEGELGIVLSKKFMEHDAFSMFDALMSGSGGAVAMVEFFSPSALGVSQTGLPPVIEASSSLYHLLSIVDSSLYNHLVELGVEPQYFALRWLRVLFGREFSLQDLLIIWDEIFASDNSKSNRNAENDAGSSIGILSSPRGAFIAAIAVSMILHLRSSLLATENATSCLQRLLNFPVEINLQKLISKAKSLQTLALDNAHSSPQPILSGASYRSESMAARGKSLPRDSISPKTPMSLVPESYWEEQWRVVHKAAELKHDSSPKEPPKRKKGWSEKMKFGLSRAESAPSPSKNESSRIKNTRPPVRRSLLEDLSRQLKLEEDSEIILFNEDQSQKLHSSEEDEVSLQDGDHKAETSLADDRCLSGNADSAGNSSIFSDPPSTFDGANSNENESERSSVASNLSNLSVYENDLGTNNVDPCQIDPENSPLPVVDSPEEISLNSGQIDDSVGKTVTSWKERKLLPAKFQWLWKFGRNGSEEPSETANASCSGTNQKYEESSSAAVGVKTSLVISKEEGVDQNVLVTLRNLGQSMLDNIQVIESVFQQDHRGQVGSSSFANNSKNVLAGKGQVTAVAALKELRKISNLLSEM